MMSEGFEAQAIVGDRIQYLEDDLRWPDENGVERIRVAHGMIGTVVMASDNLLAHEIQREFGVPERDLSWAMVEFKNGFQTNIGPRDKFEKVPEEVLGLEVGDWIVWREEKIRIVDEEGEALITPGMKGQVIALRDGCPPRLEVPGEPSFPWALVEFENGVVAAVDWDLLQ